MRMSCLVLLLVSAAAFAGCTERELDHRAASGRVEIAPRLGRAEPSLRCRLPLLWCGQQAGSGGRRRCGGIRRFLLGCPS